MYFSNRGRDGPRTITSRRSPFRIDNVSATRGNTEEHRLEGEYPIQADFMVSPNTATTARVTARDEAAIGRHQRGTTSTDQNKQFDPGGTGVNCSFLPSGYAVYCMLCCAFFSVLSSCNFPCYHTRYWRQQELSSEDGSDRDTQTRGTAFG